MDKIQKLRDILQVANQDTVSYQQLSVLLKGLGDVIQKAKEENKQVSAELKDLFNQSIDYVSKEHEKIIQTNSGILYYPLGNKQGHITSAMLFEKTAYMELFNRAVSQCKIGKNGFGVK